MLCCWRNAAFIHQITLLRLRLRLAGNFDIKMDRGCDEIDVGFEICRNAVVFTGDVLFAAVMLKDLVLGM